MDTLRERLRQQAECQNGRETQKAYVDALKEAIDQENYELVQQLISDVSAMDVNLESLVAAVEGALDGKDGDRILRATQSILQPLELNDYGRVHQRLCSFASRKLELVGRWQEAAEILAPVTKLWDINDNETFNELIRLGKLYWNAGELKSAAMFLNRAKSSESLQDTYKGYNARSLQDAGMRGADSSQYSQLSSENKLFHIRIRESGKRFLEVSRDYYILSLELAGSPECSSCLNAAIRNAILASPSDARTQLLSSLHADERCRSLELHTPLQCVYNGQILRAHSIDLLKDSVRDVKFVEGDDPTAAIHRAALEHNLSTCSKLYNNVKLRNLAGILGVSRDRTEQVAREMINEGNLRGSINQVDGIIYFHNKREVTKALSRRLFDVTAANAHTCIAFLLRSHKQAIGSADRKFEHLCSTVEKCCQLILARHPGFSPPPRPATGR